MRCFDPCLLVLALNFTVLCPGASAQDHPPAWTLVPELRIGSESDEHTALSRVTNLAVSDGGEMYVVQWQVPRVTVFSASGEFRRTLGRAGGGPGEFVQPVYIGVRGGGIWVADPLAGRITLFEPNGNVIRSAEATAPPPGPEYRTLRPRAVLADGSVLSVARAPRQFIERRIVDSGPVVKYSPSDSVVSTLAEIRLGSTGVRIPLGANRGVHRRRPLRDAPLVEPSATGAAILILQRPVSVNGGRGTFHLTKIAIDGDTLFRRAYPYEPQGVTEQTADSIYGALSATITRLYEELPEARVERAVREAVRLPRFHPPVAEMVVGRDDTIWLRRDGGVEPVATWLVLSPTGEPVARVHADVGMRLLTADLEHVWGSVTDELDVPYLLRYRIEGPGGGT